MVNELFGGLSFPGPPSWQRYLIHITLLQVLMQGGRRRIGLRLCGRHSNAFAGDSGGFLSGWRGLGLCWLDHLCRCGSKTDLRRKLAQRIPVRKRQVKQASKNGENANTRNKRK